MKHLPVGCKFGAQRRQGKSIKTIYESICKLEGMACQASADVFRVGPIHMSVPVKILCRYFALTEDKRGIFELLMFVAPK